MIVIFIGLVTHFCLPQVLNMGQVRSSLVPRQKEVGESDQVRGRVKRSPGQAVPGESFVKVKVFVKGRGSIEGSS